MGWWVGNFNLYISLSGDRLMSDVEYQFITLVFNFMTGPLNEGRSYFLVSSKLQAFENPLTFPAFAGNLNFLFVFVLPDSVFRQTLSLMAYSPLSTLSLYSPLSTLSLNSPL